MANPTGFLGGPVIGTAVMLLSSLLPLLMKGGKAAKHVAPIFGGAAKSKKHAAKIAEAIKAAKPGPGLDKLGARTPIFGPRGQRIVGAGKGQQFAPSMAAQSARPGPMQVQLPMRGGGTRTTPFNQAVSEQQKFAKHGQLGVTGGQATGLGFGGLAGYDLMGGFDSPPAPTGASAVIPELGMTEDQFLAMLMEENSPQLQMLSRGMGSPPRQRGYGPPRSGGMV